MRIAQKLKLIRGAAYNASRVTSTRPPRTALPIMVAPLAAIAGFVLMQVGSAIVARPLGFRPTLLVAEALLALPSVAALVVSGVGLRNGLGLVPLPTRSLVLSVAFGAALWGLSLGLFELQYSLWRPPAWFLEHFQAVHKLLRPLGPFDALVSFLAIALVPAACEELVFRGTVLPALLGLGATAAVTLSSMLFSAIHLQASASGELSFYQLPFTFVVGVGLALLRLRTGSLVPSILAHATVNGITFATAPFAGALDGPLPDPRPLFGATVLLGGLLGSSLFFRLLRNSLTPQRMGL
jgi:sodium transport system permease protein